MINTFTYNPANITDTQLVNDYQLNLAYFSKYSKDPESINFTSEQIYSTLKTIMSELENRGIEFHPEEYNASSREIYEKVAKEFGWVEKQLKSPFGSAGGKYYLRRVLIPKLPTEEVKRYVEPFCGAAAMFYGIEKGVYEEEILNDLDSEIIFTFKFIQAMTEADLKILQNLDWSPSKQRFKDLNDSQPKDRIQRLYKFLYTRWHAFNQMQTQFSTFGPSTQRTQKKLQYIFKVCKPRLENVKILNQDADSVIKQYDSKETLFYFDPPYPKEWDNRFGKNEFNVENFAKVLKNIQGRFLLSLNYDSTYRKLFSAFNVQKITRRAAANTFVGDSRDITKKEMIVSNYGKVVKVSQQERLKELEREQGSWYLVEENGKKHAWVYQYHVRGIWSSTEDIQAVFVALKKNDLVAAKEHLSDYMEELHLESKERAKLTSLLNEDDIAVFYEKFFKAIGAVVIEKPLKEIAPIVQKVDDEKGNVSSAFGKFVDKEPPKLADLEIKHIYNVGNVHGDFRMEEPDTTFLIGITFIVVKIAIQDLEDNIHLIIRDRFLENKPGDNWVCIKKLRVPLGWLTVVTPQRLVWNISPRETGATIETAGRYFFKAKGYGYYGTAKSDFNEFWLFFSARKYQKLDGRYDVKLLPSGRYEKVPEKEFWLMNRPEKSQVPYITTHDEDEERQKAKKDKIEIIWNDKLLSTPGMQKFEKRKYASTETAIIKIKKDKQIIIVPVLIPDEPDHAGDAITADEIEKTAYNYMMKSRKIGLMHRGNPINCQIVESRLLRQVEYENGIVYPVGTWEVGIYIPDAALWKDIKEKKYTGVSIDGLGYRRKAA